MPAGRNIIEQDRYRPFYGVGAAFYFWKIGIRAEYEQYKIKDVDRVQMYR